MGLQRIMPGLEGKTAVSLPGPSLEKNSCPQQYQHRRELVYIAADMAFGLLSGLESRPHLSCPAKQAPWIFSAGIDTGRMHLLAFSCMSHANLLRWGGGMSFYNWMMQRPEYDELWKRRVLIWIRGNGRSGYDPAVAFAMAAA